MKPLATDIRWAVGLICILGPSVFARGPRPAELEPQLLRLRIDDPVLILEVEGESRERTTKPSGGISEADELIFDGAIGLTWDGSIYHPYLLDLWLYTEVGFTRRDAEIRTDAGTPQDRDQDDQLQRYDGRLNILKKKPYATTLLGLRYDFDRRPDFFFRQRVIGERYGIRSGYRSGPWPVEVAVSHSDENTTGSRVTDRQQDTLYLSTSNHRDNNSRTRISYTLDDIHNVENFRVTQDGPVQNFRLSDISYFGRDRLSRLLSNVTAFDRDSTPVPSRSLTWRERLSLRHQPHLRSDYEYMFGYRETGPSENNIHQILASLQHQLYESLTSTGDIDVYVTRDRSNGNEASTDRYRGGFNEQYRKQLADWGRLSAGLGVWLWHTDREVSGGLRQIIDERVRLASGQVTFLQEPFVDESSVRVTDTSATIQYIRGLDYILIERGDFTEIQRVIGGTIPDGAVVLVDYVVQSQPSGSYWTVENRSFFRLSYLNDLLSLYGRIEIIDNQGGESLVLADVSRRLLGVETKMRWLRAGAEYERNASDVLPFEGIRLFQNFSLKASRNSLLSLDFTQRWIDYDEHEDSEVWSLEGGYLKERRVGFDRDRWAGRTDLEFRMGKTIIRAGYEYEDDDLRQELREEHRFWVRLRRYF